MEYYDLKNYQNWIQDNTIAYELKQQIQIMNEKELLDAFGCSLDFGTAGIRGVLGPGSNRVNIYTIRKAALAFANYLLSSFKDTQERGVVIAYDNRYMSKEFCDECATIFTSLDIKTFIFPQLSPTPELSFAVRKLHCIGGIVITASHNPKQYNGFKVYDENGCQLTPNLIAKLYPFYTKIENELAINLMEKKDKLIVLDAEIDLSYYHELLNLEITKNLDYSKTKVVYSSQHGTGYRGIKYLLEKKKYQVFYVADQCIPDPAFSKTLTPNPEDKNAYVAAIKLATEKQADIIITTDPDADRIGVVELINNEPFYFSGNQIGALLIQYILDNNKKVKNGIIYDTIVTSRLGGKIARSKGVEVQSTLTGFKFIGEKIAENDILKTHTFLFGYEESFGYLISPFVRDKDALQAALLILEMKTFYATKGQKLYNVLNLLFKEYGYHYEEVVSITFGEPSCNSQLSDVVKKLRERKIYLFADYQIIAKEDYELGKRFYYDGKVDTLFLPPSNVLRFILADGSEIAIRPSGTEPKCKIYFNLVASSRETALIKFKSLKDEILKLVK